MAVSRVKTSSILQGFPKSRSLLAGNAAYDPAATFLIQRQTATGGETSFTFNSIPQTYKSLQLRVLYRDTYTGGAQTCDMLMQFNGDTTSANYTLHYLRGNGNAAFASGGTSNGSIQMTFFGVSASSTASVYGVGIADIQDYASTTKNKTVRGFGGGDNNGVGTTSYRLGLSSGLWLSTSAITSIKVMPSITAFAAGTTFALYGMVG
jgi:hypothetical protein